MTRLYESFSVGKRRLVSVLLVDDFFNLAQMVQIMAGCHLGHVMDSLFPSLLVHAVVVRQCFRY